MLAIKVKKLMPRALAIQTKLTKIQKAGIEMEGNETDDEGEFIDVLQAEMPSVLKEMEDCISSIEDCEKMLEELKKNKSIDLMKKLQEEANTAEKMLEHKESLAAKLEPELIQWDPQAKLERRDHELDTVEDMVGNFEDKLNHEQSYFEKEMAYIEKKENDPKSKEDQKYIQKLEGQKSGLMELIQDAEDLVNENEQVREEHNRIWPNFDSEIPQSVKKVRPKRKKPSTVDSGIPEGEKGDLYQMLTSNCKFRKPIKDLLAKCKDLKHKIDDYDRKYGPLKKDINQKSEPTTYKPVKGDEIDELFAKAINKSPYANLHIVRIKQGQYMFGTKKIMAKIINGKLVIRVGGGYMSVDEFIEQYGKMELMKAIAEEERQAGHDLQHHGDVECHEDHTGHGHGSLHYHTDMQGANAEMERIREKTERVMSMQGKSIK
jgi:hypothetical protein